jgi:hypothetical protein
MYICYIEFNCYVLNFINRSLRSSFKNFQLIYEDNNMLYYNNNNQVLFQFGEINSDNNNNNNHTNSFSHNKNNTLKYEEYILDYTYPFTPLMAFGISISCIQKKLLCE